MPIPPLVSKCRCKHSIICRCQLALCQILQYSWYFGILVHDVHGESIGRVALAGSVHPHQFCIRRRGQGAG